jgi:hypothetical protein
MQTLIDSFNYLEAFWGPDTGARAELLMASLIELAPMLSDW